MAATDILATVLLVALVVLGVAIVALQEWSRR